MRKNKKTREKRIDVRLYVDEYDKLMREFKNSHMNKKAQVLRAKLFSKGVTEDLKQQHEALLAAAETNTSLIKLGTNINQLV